ncbi:MAG: uracil-DNA glycosylase [Cycloclasticus sp.]
MFKEFINQLMIRESSDSVFNPYRDRRIANNLKIYFEYLHNNQDKFVLLIGEAPGYAGCRITGIPFTSGVSINKSRLQVFKELKHKLYISPIESEKTATIVWDYLESATDLPIFWNSFPFHPHAAGDQFSNRAPTKSEIEEGTFYIETLIRIFNPTVISAIGRKGEQALKGIFPDKHIEYIRHPSHGGKSEFLLGIKKVV